MERLEQIILSNKNKSEINVLEKQILNKANSLSQKFEVYQKISETYFKANQVNKSIEYLFKGKDIAEEIGDAELLTKVYGSISNQYSYLNLNDKARSYLNMAIAQIEKLPPGDNKFTFKALSFLELGNFAFNDEKYKEANANYCKSLIEFNHIKNLREHIRYHYRRSLYNIGNSYYYLNEADSAEIYLNRALLYKDSQNPSLKYYINSSLSEVYASQKNYKRAIDTLQAILDDKDFKIDRLKSEIYLNLSKNYKLNAENSNYVLYNEKYLKLRKELEGSQLKAINTAFDAEQKEYQTSISDSDKKNSLLIASIVAVVFGSLVFIYFLLKKRKKDAAIYKSIIDKLESRDELSVSDTDSGEILQSNHSIPEAVEEKILASLQKFEDSHKFTNPKLSISVLAVYLKTNSTYVYEILNKHKKKNFNAYINELRINYICNEIHNDPKYLDYKISYLAEISGFTSHSAFATVFKNVTGIAPSVFINQARKTNLEKSI